MKEQLPPQPKEAPKEVKPSFPMEGVIVRFDVKQQIRKRMRLGK